jgi:multidrug efflux system membrane fusion protein
MPRKSTYKAAVAATEVAAKSVDDTVLKAPISGQVSQRLAQPGERVGIDTKIVEIVDLSRLELEATLSAADSMDVRVGQSAQLQIEGSRQPVRRRGAHQPQRAGRQPQRAGLPHIDNPGATGLKATPRRCARACLPKARWARRARRCCRCP